jgi:hypothetical protein
MASFLSDMFGGGAEAEAADKNRALYNQYGTQGQGYLDTGLTQSTGALNSGVGAYAPLSALASKYGAGTDMYMNSLGLNGPAGNTAATNAFQAGPGYQFQMDQGLDAINRQRAAAGMLGSGNAGIDAMKYGQGLANQAYGGWQTQLSGLNNNALAATTGAATGQAGQYDQLANLFQQNATNQIGLQGNVTSGLASANNTQAAGEAAGAKNLLGLGMSILGAVAGGPLGAALGGGLGGLFGSSPSYGGGNSLSGDAYGGSALKPLPGLTAADYG